MGSSKKAVPRPRVSRPTIENVAAKAGVSRGTVSRYLNGGINVSSRAKTAISDAIQEIGYRANAHARSLASAKANSVVFLLTAPVGDFFADENFANIVERCSALLSEMGVSLVLMMAHSQQDRRNAMSYVLAGHVDAVLLFSLTSDTLEVARELLDGEVPVVACGAPLGADPRLTVVMADDYQGAYDATRLLVNECGCRRVIHVLGRAGSGGRERRLAGYRAGLGNVCQPLAIEGDYTLESGRRAIRKLLASNESFDGVFAANDAMARGAALELAEHGLRVPDDVQIIGFDDSASALCGPIALSTVHQPFARISEEMIRLVTAPAGSRNSAQTIVPVNLVERDSTRRMRSSLK